ENAGFGKANNLGAKQARGEYLLFLNSDTQVIDSAHLKLLEHAKKHQAKLSSCQLLNPDGSIQPQGGHLPSLTNLFAQMLFLDDLPFIRSVFPSYQKRDVAFFQKDQSMGWIGGTAMLIKSDFFKSLGGFDEHIFMYAEDVDLCWRAQQQGVRPYYCATPQITHLGQASTSSRQ